jgi:hypothetical protein
MKSSLHLFSLLRSPSSLGHVTWLILLVPLFHSSCPIFSANLSHPPQFAELYEILYCFSYLLHLPPPPRGGAGARGMVWAPLWVFSGAYVLSLPLLNLSWVDCTKSSITLLSPCSLSDPYISHLCLFISFTFVLSLYLLSLSFHFLLSLSYLHLARSAGIYDKVADRFILTVFLKWGPANSARSSIYVAIAAQSNPSLAWRTYLFDG